RQLELASAARFAALLRFGREPQPYLPQQLAPRQAERVASAHPHQVLDRVALEPGRRAPHEVADAPERAAAHLLRHDGTRRLLAPIADEPEPDPHRGAFDVAPHFA